MTMDFNTKVQVALIIVLTLSFWIYLWLRDRKHKKWLGKLKEK